MTPQEIQLLQDIDVEITALSTAMKDTRNIFDDKLSKRLSFLKWVNKNWKLRSSAMPRVVKQ